MQNRYVADIGDYLKLSILRELLGKSPRMRLGVAWWLFPDETHNGDGGYREYLQRPKDWREFDPGLFDALKKIDEGKRWDVRTLEEEEYACLPTNSVFAFEPVPCDCRPYAQRPLERKKWLSKIKARLDNCDFIFLDPDNGIAPPTLKLTQRRAGKSVTIEEIVELSQKRPTVVYHHQTRRVGGHQCEIDDLTTRLKKHIKVSGVLRAKPWSPRVFFILNGNSELQGRAKSIAEHWKDKISWFPDDEKSYAIQTNQLTI